MTSYHFKRKFIFESFLSSTFCFFRIFLCSCCCLSNFCCYFSSFMDNMRIVGSVAECQSFGAVPAGKFLCKVMNKSKALTCWVMCWTNPSLTVKTPEVRDLRLFCFLKVNFENIQGIIQHISLVFLFMAFPCWDSLTL